MKKAFIILVSILLIMPFQNVRASSNYPAGSLLAIQGVKGAAVYYIGSDGNKYVFPDEKTYFTWYANFDDVVKVNVTELDKYPDGGIMPFRPGTKLVTHANTANVYAVEPDGVLKKIPSEEYAKKLYGENWVTLVQDVTPGFFAVSYSVVEGIFREGILPTGSLIRSENWDTIYYVNNGVTRKFANNEAFEKNGFDYKNVVVVKDLSKYYTGPEIIGKEDILFGFSKDTWYKYSDYNFTYEIASGSSGVAVRFTNPINRDLEIRKMIAYAPHPLLASYDDDINNKFNLIVDNQREYSDSPIKFDNFNAAIIINSDRRYDIFVNVKEWVIWDNTANKQVLVKY